MTPFQFPRVQDIVEAPDGMTCEIQAGDGACEQPAATLCVAARSGDRPPTTLAVCDEHTPVKANNYDEPGTGRWTLRSRAEVERTQEWYQLPQLERHCLVAIGLAETSTPAPEGDISRHLLQWYGEPPSAEARSAALARLTDASLITETTHGGETAYKVSERGRELLAVGAAHLGAAAARPTSPGL